MTIEEVAENLQFTIDQNGQITAVVLTPKLWRRIVEALEDSADRDLVRAVQTKLASGPNLSGALRWEAIAGEWQ